MIEQILLSLGISLFLGLIIAATWGRETFKRSFIKWFIIILIMMILLFSECLSFSFVGEHEIDVFGRFQIKFTPEWLTVLCLGVIISLMSLGFDYLFKKNKV